MFPTPRSAGINDFSLILHYFPSPCLNLGTFHDTLAIYYNSDSLYNSINLYKKCKIPDKKDGMEPPGELGVENCEAPPGGAPCSGMIGGKLDFKSNPRNDTR